jgi:hypothetical protein
MEYGKEGGRSGFGNVCGVKVVFGMEWVRSRYGVGRYARVEEYASKGVCE